MSQMKIDITSDVICPFCLIGVKQLLTAIDRYKTLHPNAYSDFSLRLLPFQLNAALTEKPMPRRKYLAEKFGPERAEMIAEGMGPRFAAVGCKSDLNGDISSSHLAHRLQTYALLEHPDSQLPLAMDIFTGFHSDRYHPSDKEWLSSLAAKHGLFPSPQEARAWLDGNECDAEVRRAYKNAHALGVTGVPFFVFQDRYAASGAMGVDEFVHLFEEIARRDKLAQTPSPDSSQVASPTSTFAADAGSEGKCLE